MAQQTRSMAEVVANMMNTRETEFARVARFLHDQVGQVLSAVGLQLDVLRLDFKGRVPEITERTAEIQKILEEAIAQVREMSYELNPAIVERAGLQFALNRLAGKFRTEFPGKLRLLFDPVTQLPKDSATAFYKIAEEATANAIKHSGCKQIEILVRPTRLGAVLEIKDNGSGFDFPATREQGAGVGLILMEHYARRAGLRFTVTSSAGKGTIVKVLNPVRQGA
jgi:signal transduction histidine kinase